VIVAPSIDGLGLDDSEVKDFYQVRVVEVGALTSTAKARAAGIRQAGAPVVALVEDHAFPATGWAEALIEAHRQPWAAVGPVMFNANPHSVISWANLIIEYAEWLDPCPAGVAEHLPGHNGSYKRAHLLEYGDKLEAMMEAESVLQWDLRAKGYQLYLEPAAKTYHQNFSSAFSCIPLRFHGGRLFAASRARGWSPLRRLLYAVSAPIIPLVRLLRMVRQLRRPGRKRDLLPRVLPALIAGLIVDGTGEMAGYALGAGGAMRKLSDMEFHRERYLCKRDKLAEMEA
jgi:GT2 family glycosyltransferase